MDPQIGDFGIWPLLNSTLMTSAVALSGGQQQRLCLARVLALEPEIILLDEPTSGLDPISTGKVEESLQELKQNYTIILVPHSVQQAARATDCAAFFLQGELIEFAPGKEIFYKPTRSKDRRLCRRSIWMMKC
jgi:phosphate transport system ATP-binding protein